MSEGHLSRRELAKIAYGRFVMGIPILALIFFLPAGTLAYWQGWVYIAVLYIPLLFVVGYLLKNAPDLLERRMKLNERESQQQWVIKLAGGVFLLVFLLPGFDYRWGWSHAPVWLVILADALVVAGYGLIFLVFRENRYAARVVDVEEEQQVISSGPYAVVRHPMYTLFFIQALGYLLLTRNLFIGGVYLLALTLIVITRTRREEQTMEAKFGEQYRAYTRTTGRFLPRLR